MEIRYPNPFCISDYTDVKPKIPAIIQAKFNGVLATAYQIIPYLYFWPAWPGDANPML